MTMINKVFQRHSQLLVDKQFYFYTKKCLRVPLFSGYQVKQLEQKSQTRQRITFEQSKFWNRKSTFETIQ